MATRQTKNSKFVGLTIPLACILILGYFGVHAFQGSFGVKSRAMMDREELQLQFELTRLREQRKDLQWRVALLREGRIEKDMLDQQVRHMLNLVKPDELVILLEAN